MSRAQRLVMVVVCAAVLVLVGSWTTGVVAIGERQRAPTSLASSIDPLVLKALRWRGIATEAADR